MLQLQCRDLVYIFYALPARLQVPLPETEKENETESETETETLGKV